MNVTAFEAMVENGLIVLPASLRLPEKLKVYVLIPDIGIDVKAKPVARIGSPRLADPDQAEAFRKQIIEEDADADI